MRALRAASVEVHAKQRLPLAEGAPFGCQNFIHVGAVFEDRAEPVFHRNRHAQVRSAASEDVERGCGENAIA